MARIPVAALLLCAACATLPPSAPPRDELAGPPPPPAPCVPRPPPTPPKIEWVPSDCPTKYAACLSGPDAAALTAYLDATKRWMGETTRRCGRDR